MLLPDLQQVRHLKKGYRIPPCCGKLMEIMD
jgi:hypothetical protein